MTTKLIIEFFPDGSMTRYEFNDKGQVLQECSDGVDKPYFEHDFNGYMPYFK